MCGLFGLLLLMVQLMTGRGAVSPTLLFTAGVAATGYGVWSRRRADDPVVLADRARTLLGQIITAESRALQQLLGDTGDPKPADIGFAQPPDMVRWRFDGGTETGSLATIVDYYHTLILGRLVVLGEPGSGKTVLVIKLLLDLATGALRTTSGANPAAPVVVPVRLSLPAFTATDQSPALVREELDRWISTHLVTVYGLESAVAQALVAHGWVLPVLDGLDEMDPDGADPRRARAVLAALNLSAGPERWPIVLTCRTHHYTDLANPGPGTVGGGLQDATIVSMQPLDVEQIINWLAHRFPSPGHSDCLHPRWRPVATQLRQRPTGDLACCLSSPLLLYLAVTVYHHPNNDPGPLCTLDAVALEDHLYSQLIPAVTDHCLRIDGTRYRAEDVTRWLCTLANHLAWMGTHGHSAVDLHLHELWRTAGNPEHPGRRVRHKAAALVGGLSVLPLLVLGLIDMSQSDTEISRNPDRWFVVASLMAVIFVTFFRGSNSPNTRPLQRLDPRLALSVAGGRKIVVLMTKYFLFGAFFGSLIGLFTQLFAVNVPVVETVVGGALTVSVVFSIFGLLFGFLEAGEANQQAAARPSAPQRQALAYSIARGIAGGALFGPLYGFVGFSFDYGPVVSIVASIGSGITMGIGAMVLSGPTPWARYSLAIRSLARTKNLPRRPGQFLDWAHAAGLVRLAGTATQFRHRTLQARLCHAQYGDLAGMSPNPE